MLFDGFYSLLRVRSCRSLSRTDRGRTLTAAIGSSCRLDQILGKQGSKAKDVYASKISLASRVVKIERQVDDIETKLDQFIELYIEDRKRILNIPLSNEVPKQITGTSSSTAGVPQCSRSPEKIDVRVTRPCLTDCPVNCRRG